MPLGAETLMDASNAQTAEAALIETHTECSEEGSAAADLLQPERSDMADPLICDKHEANSSPPAELPQTHSPKPNPFLAVDPFQAAHATHQVWQDVTSLTALLTDMSRTQQQAHAADDQQLSQRIQSIEATVETLLTNSETTHASLADIRAELDRLSQTQTENSIDLLEAINGDKASERIDSIEESMQRLSDSFAAISLERTDDAHSKKLDVILSRIDRLTLAVNNLSEHIAEPKQPQKPQKPSDSQFSAKESAADPKQPKAAVAAQTKSSISQQIWAQTAGRIAKLSQSTYDAAESLAASVTNSVLNFTSIKYFMRSSLVSPEFRFRTPQDDIVPHILERLRMSGLKPTDAFSDFNVFIIDTIAETDLFFAAIAPFRSNIFAVGLDVEKAFREINPNAPSMIQIAFANNLTAIFLVYRMCCSSPSESASEMPFDRMFDAKLFPKTLASFLNDGSIAKVGVGLHKDAIDIYSSYHTTVSNTVDLYTLGKAIGVSGSLASLSKSYCDMELSKNRNFGSLHSWDSSPRMLKPSAIRYAAYDAHASLLLFRAMVVRPSHGVEVSLNANIDPATQPSASEIATATLEPKSASFEKQSDSEFDPQSLSSVDSPTANISDYGNTLSLLMFHSVQPKIMRGKMKIKDIESMICNHLPKKISASKAASKIPSKVRTKQAIAISNEWFSAGLIEVTKDRRIVVSDTGKQIYDVVSEIKMANDNASYVNTGDKSSQSSVGMLKEGMTMQQVIKIVEVAEQRLKQKQDSSQERNQTLSDANNSHSTNVDRNKPLKSSASSSWSLSSSISRFFRSLRLPFSASSVLPVESIMHTAKQKHST